MRSARIVSKEVGEIRYSTIPGLQQELDAANRELESLHRDGGLLREVVTAEEIAEIVARWTGIPVTRLHGEQPGGLRVRGRREGQVGAQSVDGHVGPGLGGLGTGRYDAASHGRLEKA